MGWLSFVGEAIGLANRALGFLRGNGTAAKAEEALQRVEQLVAEVEALRDAHERAQARTPAPAPISDELAEKARELLRQLDGLMPLLAEMDPHASAPDPPGKGRRRTPTRRQDPRRKGERG